MDRDRRGLLCMWLMGGGISAWGQARPSAALDFELSDGHQFVRLSRWPPQPTIVNFWHHACPPCVREMPLLAAQAQTGRVRVITVALHRPDEDALAPPAVRQALTQVQPLYGPSQPAGLLARFGNPKGALPHTVLLDADRHACAMHTGEVDARWLAQAMAQCTRRP